MPPTKEPPSKQRRIVFTVYPGVSLLDLSGPLEAFRVADAFSAPPGQGGMYDCVVVSSRGGARAYSKMRGRTPAKAVEAIRVDAARRRLQGDYHQ